MQDFDEKNSKVNWKNPNFKNREKAAKLLQSWYRGAVVRRDIRKMIKAATKIQAGFKGFKTREETHDQLLEVHEHNIKRKNAAIKLQNWIRGCLIQKKFKIERKAAAVIQAHFRGFLARKELKEA